VGGAIAEAHQSRRTQRGLLKVRRESLHRFALSCATSVRHLEFLSHVLTPPQSAPWLYKELGKKEAFRLLQANGMEDGLFLIRGSKVGNGYVLMLCEGERHHTYRIHEVSE
jgi:hypothetical protein